VPFGKASAKLNEKTFSLFCGTDCHAQEAGSGGSDPLISCSHLRHPRPALGGRREAGSVPSLIGQDVLPPETPGLETEPCFLPAHFESLWTSPLPI